jgi:hypothetical protein
MFDTESIDDIASGFRVDSFNSSNCPGNCHFVLFLYVESISIYAILLNLIFWLNVLVIQNKTMAIQIKDFDINCVIFEEPKQQKFGNIVYYNIPIKYKEGTRVSECCFATPEIFTYGVQENRDPKKGADTPVESYSLPIVMSNLEFNEMMANLLDKCKKHLMEKSVKSSMNKGDKLDNLTENMEVLHYKLDNGQIVDGSVPTLYPKLLTAYKKDKSDDSPPKITTEFYNMESENLDPLHFIGRRAYVIAAIIVKNIYIGAKPSIQLKVNDVLVTRESGARKRLIDISKATLSIEPTVKSEESDESEEEKVAESIEKHTVKIVRRRKD